ncbi:MAG TPA: histidine phosphatase family protein [Ktedonobacteraceae bacterium]|nr:histidine phosphatase family protein [Ktedonobacteraceae bacterium]
MYHLILVKHSLPEVLPDVPAKDWHLSEEGRRRCKVLAGQLAFYRPAIFSSVEPKAVETASLLSSSLGLSFQTVEGLHEHDRSGVGWLGPDELKAAAARFFSQPDQLVFGQETATQACERFTKAVEAILDKSPQQDVLLVTHGTVITLFLAYYTKVEPFPLWESLDLPAFAILPLPLVQGPYS